MKQEVNKLLQKQMDRKAFLKHIGIGFIAITGFATLLKTLNGLSGGHNPVQGTGYGTSAYGGNRLGSSQDGRTKTS